MDAEQLQPQKWYSLPIGARIKVVGGVVNHDAYVIHPRGSYYRLEAKLLKVNAPQLSYRLFYLLASELQHPYGNVLSYSVKQLAHHFTLSDASIYVALGKLLMADAARKVQKQRIALDPYIAFAGDMKHREAARQQWDDDTIAVPDTPLTYEDIQP